MSGEALAVIIGRAGSRGLPGKNARVIGGRPMICHTIAQARAAHSVGRIVVSTDGDQIAAAATSMNDPRLTVLRRPPELATDDAPVAAALRHAWMALGRGEHVIVLLYANVPLRPPGLIDRAVAALLETGADSVQSYAPVGRHHPSWMVTLGAGGRVNPHVPNAVDRRQDLPALHLPDGGVIAVTASSLERSAREAHPHAFLGADRRGIVTGIGDVVDVDDASDLVLAESRLSRPRSGAGAAAPSIRIGERLIGPGEPPYVIAELGVNHDGDRAVAIELVAAAKEAGADAVKLQWFEAAKLLSRSAGLAAYQRASGAADPFSMLAALELDAVALSEIVAAAHAMGLHAIVTIFSLDHVGAAGEIPFDALKSASPDLVNRPLLEALAATGRPLLVSTGAASAAEVAAAASWLGDVPHLFMHCVSAYPAPEECAALAGLAAMRAITPRALGYSDHTTALDTGALAVAAGAVLLEKHLTLDPRRPGPDHAVSLGPADLRRYVDAARRAWRMLGPPLKRVLEIELEVRETCRQSLTAARDLGAGCVLRASDLQIRRPGTGIGPAYLEVIVGRRLRRAVAAGAPLREEDLD